LEDGVSDELEDGVSWGKYDKAAVTAFSSICAELGYDKTSEEFVTVKELLKKYNGKLEGKVACA